MVELTREKTGEKLSCDFKEVNPDAMEDILGFQACIRDEYGESYPRDYIYKPHELAEKIRQGEILCYLALSDRKDPVASLALTPFKGLERVPEMTMHVVRKTYRGFGVGTEFTKAVLDSPPIDEYNAVAIHSVTFHSIAQRQTISCGFLPTGFLLSVHSNDILKHSFDINGCRKQSFAVAVLPKGKKDAGSLHLPPEHESFIKGIYEKLSVVFKQADGKNSEGKTEYHCEQDETHLTKTTEVFKCGEDFEKLTDALLQKPYKMGQTINVFINLNDPCAVYAYEVLKNRGFIFTGLHPLCANGEFMIMHHPLGLGLPLDRLEIDEGYRRVYDYIAYGQIKSQREGSANEEKMPMLPIT
ncbi:MAG: hypothetical protein GX025_07180 [Clostridiales bacterium]|nr:hypothetical protein [Clostridiales bacterium]